METNALHDTTLASIQRGSCYERFEFSIRVSMNIQVFWDITPCQPVHTYCSYRQFEGTSLFRNVGTIYQSTWRVIPEGLNHHRQHRQNLYFAAHGQIQYSYVSYHIKFISFFIPHPHPKKHLGVWPLKGWAEEANKEAGKQGIFLLWDLWAFFFLSSTAGDKNRYLTELPWMPVCSPTRRKE